MKGYIVNLEEATLANNSFRQVLYTASHSQLVLMSIAPGDDIGEEIHDLDQFIRIEAGVGKAILNNVEYELKDGSAVIVPAGVKHNILNTSSEPLKLYTVYSPPEHKDGVSRLTKKQALENEEHFDGAISE